MKKVMLVANTDWYLFNFRYSFIKLLVEKKFEVILVSPSGPYVSRLIEIGCHWLEWRVGRKTVLPWTEIKSIISLARLYLQEKPSVIHHHTIKTIIYGTIAAWVTKSAFVINSVAGLGYVFSSGMILARLLRPINSLLLWISGRYPHQFWIFENEEDREKLQKLKIVGDENVQLIEGVGVDVERFQSTPEPGGLPVILFVGRFLWDKGLGVFIEAVQQIRGKHNIRVVLAGKIDEENPGTIQEHQLNQWVNEGTIQYHGWFEKIEDAYEQAHIVVSPSMYGEGVQTVLLEASACARAIVASDIPGSRNVIRNGVNGLLVPKNDSVALSHAITQLVEDGDLRQAFGEAARMNVVSNFTNQKINKATLSIYYRATR